MKHKKRLKQLRLSGADYFLLRWVLMCMLTLGTISVLFYTGVLYELELEQIRFLGGSPFYISAEEAQVSLLHTTGIFAICIAVTLYMGMAQLRERRFGGRLQMALISTVALALPGLLCVLWGGILNMAAPVICTLSCWLLAELEHLVRGWIHHFNKKRNVA